MGEWRRPQGSLFCGFRLEAHVPADPLIRAIDRFVDRAVLRRGLAPFCGGIGRPSIDPGRRIRVRRGRLLLRHPRRAAPLPGGAPEPGLPLILPARPDRRGARPFDLLDEPPRPVPRLRPVPPAVRGRAGAPHRRGSGGGRSLRGRPLADPGGRPPRGRDRVRALAPGGARQPRRHGRSGDARRRGLRRGDVGRAEARLAARSCRAPARGGSGKGACPVFRRRPRRCRERAWRRPCRSGRRKAGPRVMIARAFDRFRLYPPTPGRRRRLRLGRDARPGWSTSRGSSRISRDRQGPPRRRRPAAATTG